MNTRFFMNSCLCQFHLDAFHSKIFYVINSLIVITMVLVSSPIQKQDSDLLRSALLDGVFRDSLLISLAVIIPCIMELVLDIFFLSRDTRKDVVVVPPGFFSRAISLSVTLSSTIVLLYYSSYNLPSNRLYWTLLHLQYMGLTLAALGYLRKFGHDFWTRSKIIVITTLQGISHILRVHDGYILNFESISGIMSIIFFFSALLYYSYQIYQWYKLKLRFITIKMLTPSIFCCILYMIELWIVFVSAIIILFIYYNTPVAECSIYFITISSYFFSFFISINCTIHSRGFRLAIASAEEMLSMRRLIVRYLSHEMRNPVNVINLGLKILTRETKGAMENELFLEMQHASDTIAHILDDLLIYEKIEGSELDMKLEDVHAQTFIRKCALDIFHKHRNANVRLRVVEGSENVSSPNTSHRTPKSSERRLFDVSVRRVVNRAESGISISWLNVDKSSLRRAVIQADTSKLSHIVEKVLTTAIKVSPPGAAVKVTCRVLMPVAKPAAGEGSGGEPVPVGGKLKNFQLSKIQGKIFRVEVEDTGMEILQDFERLSEFDIGKLQGGQGSGLGLWVTKRIVDMHQGHMGVEPNKGGTGSTFFLEIPVKCIDLMMSKDSLDPVGIDQSLFSQHGVLNSRSSPPLYRINTRTSQVLSDLNLNSFDISNRSLGQLMDFSYDDLRVPTTSRMALPHESDSVRSFSRSLQSMQSINSLNSRRMNFYLREYSNKMSQNSLDSSPSFRTPVVPPDSVGNSANNTPVDSPNDSTTSRSIVQAFMTFVRTLNPDTAASDRSLLSVGSERKRRTSSVDEKCNEDVIDKTEIMTKKLSCLIVDDVTSNRKMLARLLANEFESFEYAEDGLQAVEIVRDSLKNKKSSLDVILMDYVMPNMDGPTASREIRGLGYQGPIFGVTGNAQQKDIDHFIRCGVNRVFTKPLDVPSFTLAISRYKK